MWFFRENFIDYTDKMPKKQRKCYKTNATRLLVTPCTAASHQIPFLPFGPLVGNGLCAVPSLVISTEPQASGEIRNTPSCHLERAQRVERSPKHCNTFGDSSTSASPTLRMTLVGDGSPVPQNPNLSTCFKFRKSIINPRRGDY